MEHRQKLEVNKYKVKNYFKNLFGSRMSRYPYINEKIQLHQNTSNKNMLKMYEKLFSLFDPNINLDQFKDILTNNLILLRSFGFQKIYSLKLCIGSKYLKTEGNDEEIINITPKNIANSMIEDIFYYSKMNLDKKKEFIKQKIKCSIVSEYKANGNIYDPSSYRYYFCCDNIAKILDKLWCIELLQNCKNNLPDNEIFKYNYLCFFIIILFKTR
jgi:hypothetical protein